MSVLLLGKPAADALDAETAECAARLKQNGVTPTLAILRIGENPDDLSYERAAVSRAEALGISVRVTAFPADTEQNSLIAMIRAWNADSAIHGILLMRPLPDGMDEAALCEAIAPKKDVDGVTRASMAGVYAGTGDGFAPCTAEACIVLLDHYGVEISGKRVSVIGRSLVIGRPVSAMLTARNATVTLCHSHTGDLPGVILSTDLVVAALGRAEYLHKEMFTAGQTVLDVGINYSQEKKKLVGDVDFDEVSPLVQAISPVPGGVGSVTTSVLCRHVVLAAKKAQNPEG